MIKEEINMNKFRFLKRALCIALSASMVLSLAACGGKQEDSGTSGEEKAPQPTYTDAPGSVHKSETVYVNLDASGNPTGVTVSDWLHTDRKEVRVEDQSDLTGIENVKDDTQPVTDGNKLVWNMSATDLYYQGQSDKALPVDIAIRYELNGQEVQPAEIAGQSGRVKITVSIQNNTAQRRVIDGKEVTVYAPIALIGGGIFPESQFSAVEAENGTVIGDGSKQIAAFIAFPGMNDSLNLAQSSIPEISSIRFPEQFSITADATDFTMGNMMFAMITSLPAFDTLAASGSVEEIKSTLYALRGMQASLSQLDPNGSLMDLFTQPEQLDTLTGLAAGLASLYDLNRAAIQIMPRYVNVQNVALVTRMSEDIQSSRLLQVLTDQNVQSLIQKVGEVDYTQLKGLVSQLIGLSDVDLGKLTELIEGILGSSDLTELLNTSASLADTLAQHPDQMALMGKLIGCTPEITTLVTQLITLKDQMDQLHMEITQEDLQVMVAALVDHKMPDLTPVIREMVIQAVLKQLAPVLETGSQLSAKLEDLTAEDVEGLMELLTQILPDIPGLMEQLVAHRGELHSIVELLNNADVRNSIQELAGLLSQLKETLSPLMDSAFLRDVLAASQNPDVRQLAEFLPVLLKDLMDAAPVLESLQGDLEDPQVRQCLENLPQTLAVLLRIRTDLQANSSIVDALAGAMNPDTLKTAGGLLSQLDALQAGVDLDAYTGAAETADMLLKRAQAMLEVGQQHTIFTQRAQGMTSDLKFIMKTQEIRANG